MQGTPIRAPPTCSTAPPIALPAENAPVSPPPPCKHSLSSAQAPPEASLHAGPARCWPAAAPWRMGSILEGGAGGWCVSCRCLPLMRASVQLATEGSHPGQGVAQWVHARAATHHSMFLLVREKLCIARRLLEASKEGSNPGSSNRLSSAMHSLRREGDGGGLKVGLSAGSGQESSAVQGRPPVPAPPVPASPLTKRGQAQMLRPGGASEPGRPARQGPPGKHTGGEVAPHPALLCGAPCVARPGRTGTQ